MLGKVRKVNGNGPAAVWDDEILIFAIVLARAKTRRPENSRMNP